MRTARTPAKNLSRSKASGCRSVLGVSEATLESMDSVVTEHLQGQLNDPGAASLQDILHVVKQRWLEVSRELWPLRAQRPARIYRLGINLFAVQEPQPGTALAKAEPPPMPDFSHAVTRPVGVGDLQVVRQRLIGYEAADISHIENVLPGELLRRTTLREETTELIVTDETETTQSEERDTQTTERNELWRGPEGGGPAEHHDDRSDIVLQLRPAGREQQDQLRARRYRSSGQQAHPAGRQQRVQREKKTVLRPGAAPARQLGLGQDVRGIYQWVDKKYQVRCSTTASGCSTTWWSRARRVPHQRLKTRGPAGELPADQAARAGHVPWQLNGSNYDYYAALYGVTGIGHAAAAPNWLPPVAEAHQRSRTVRRIEAPTARSGPRILQCLQDPVPEGY